MKDLHKKSVGPMFLLSSTFIWLVENTFVTFLKKVESICSKVDFFSLRYNWRMNVLNVNVPPSLNRHLDCSSLVHVEVGPHYNLRFCFIKKLKPWLLKKKKSRVSPRPINAQEFLMICLAIKFIHVDNILLTSFKMQSFLPMAFNINQFVNYAEPFCLKTGD